MHTSATSARVCRFGLGAGLVVALGIGLSGFIGCSGPTCQTACEKAFVSCGLTWLGNDSSQSEVERIQSCSAACNTDMKNAQREPLAVGWVSCVDAYRCNPDGNGLDLCLDCSSGYYMGRTDGATCSSAEQTSLSPF